MDDETILAEYQKTADILKKKIDRLSQGRHHWDISNPSKELTTFWEMYNDCLWMIRLLDKRLSRRTVTI